MMIELIKEQLKKIPFLVKIKRHFFGKSYSQKQIENMVFSYYRGRFHKYSGAFHDSKEKNLAYLTWLYHVVEKGLAMPEMRLGFGYEKVKELSKNIVQYKGKYGVCKEITSAVSVLLEYERVHKEYDFSLDIDVKNSIDMVKSNFPNVLPEKQVVVNRNSYFNKLNRSFPEFSASRHSVRNFSTEPLSMSQIVDSIELAKNAPSACNRQPTRIHIVDGKNLIQKCLSLQNGNRGFGHLTDKLLIITGEMGTLLGSQELLDLNTNVGIFIMNLCYALHYNKVAHCVLNWYVEPNKDKKLREIVDIPNGENIVAFIICGNAPTDDFKLVSSPRLDTELLYTIHRG